MTYNVYIDLIEEVYQRLKLATENNAFPLMFSFRFYSEEIGRSFLRVGATQTVEGNDYLPSLQILWGGAEEGFSVIASNQMSSLLTVILRIHYPLDDADATNVLYDKTTQKGILYFICEVLDVINTKIETGLHDPRLLASAKDSMRCNVGEIVKNHDKLTCDIVLTVGTDNFPINRRNSF